MMNPKGFTFCYYVSGHGFGHATRVNQIITELLKYPSLTSDSTSTSTSNNNSTSRHTIFIVSDAPQFIFQDVIALGAIYRNAKIDAGVVQPLAYSVDREKTIEGVKTFLAKRDEMIQSEVSWLAEVGADCVLADAPFLPCAAASAYGIPACLITNFTFDEVYRYLREGDPLDKDVIAVADTALEDYKKASLLLRLPGSIDIPSFEDEILTMESSGSNGAPSVSDMDDDDDLQERMSVTTPAHSSGAMSPASVATPTSSPNSGLSGSGKFSSVKIRGLLTRRRAIDVPLVVRMAVNTREDVLRSLGVDEETIVTKKMALVSFGGQRLKQGWGNPLPEGWIGVICGLPVEHELPPGFYRSPHGVYVPDLTRAADVVIGKLGYGTCSECIAHDTPLIYVSRPQFVEEHGLTRMMNRHGLSVEMTAEEFETGNWQRSILETDRLVQEEKEGRRLFMESCSNSSNGNSDDDESSTVASGRITRSSARLQRKRPASMDALAEVGSNKGHKMARLSLVEDEDKKETLVPLTDATLSKAAGGPATGPSAVTPAVWFERRIPNNGGEVCARLVEEFLHQLEVDQE